MSEFATKDTRFWVKQADAYLVTASPVSGTKYMALATTTFVRIYGIHTKITWGVTQPTPLEIHTTIDAVAGIYTKTDPVTATNYFSVKDYGGAETVQPLATTNPVGRAYLEEGKSVKIEHEITWSTTQPTNLTTRVKYARYI